MYLLNATSGFSEKAIQALDTYIKANTFFFSPTHRFVVRDLHVIITERLQIWLWVLGLHVPRLALIGELEDRDEKKHTELAGVCNRK